jgi:RNA-binding protein Musashi
MTATHRCTCGVRAESFRDYFVQFGCVADVVIMYDNTTKRSRGFGFITFDAGRIS